MSEGIGLIGIVVMLLIALYRIMHGDEREARDVAEKAFRRGMHELERFWKEDR